MTHKEFTKAYEREGHLGGGGFGQVFKAYDINNDRYVAIKRSEVKPEFKDFTLMREYELAKEIPSHPNICPYENCFRFSEGFIDADYAILKYYEYGNISEFLEKQTLSDREKKQLIKGILQGVEHLHKNNIIHRDLKAGNILIDREDGVWRPKIADFGLSKVIDKKQLTKSLHNSSIGVSFHYAAPEQITGDRKILPNVDLWAVGVIIYQILTAEMPFQSDNPDSTVNQSEVSHKVTNLIFPEKFNTIVEPYQSMIKQCWVKDPKKRVQKVEVLLEKLGESKKPLTPKLQPKPEEEETIINKPKPESPPVNPKPSVAEKNSSTPKSQAKSKTPFIVGAAALVILLIALFIWQPWNTKLHIEWVDIPAGTFIMGSPTNEEGRGDDEIQHEVTLSAFKMSKYEITFDQYDSFCKQTGREKPNSSFDGQIRKNHPVMNVNWHDATAFAEWMGCRLPTEAEWEYAARGSNRSNNYKYSGSDSIKDVAWYENNRLSQRELVSRAVGIKFGNEVDIFDMSGNVFEWCYDFYDSTYYHISPTFNPQGPKSGQRRVLRGGCFMTSPYFCRVAARAYFPPDTKARFIGFRVVYSQ